MLYSSFCLCLCRGTVRGQWKDGCHSIIRRSMPRAQRPQNNRREAHQPSDTAPAATVSSAVDRQVAPTRPEAAATAGLGDPPPLRGEDARHAGQHDADQRQQQAREVVGLHHRRRCRQPRHNEHDRNAEQQQRTHRRLAAAAAAAGVRLRGNGRVRGAVRGRAARVVQALGVDSGTAATAGGVARRRRHRRCRRGGGAAEAHGLVRIAAGVLERQRRAARPAAAAAAAAPAARSVGARLAARRRRRSRGEHGRRRDGRPRARAGRRDGDAHHLLRRPGPVLSPRAVHPKGRRGRGRCGRGRRLRRRRSLGRPR
eukprot:Rhum_TRINITY_DN14934_c3_g1::Rhum_TRINITY_DN14934_c3_g1_i1::g.129307::m.129307